VKGYLAGSYEVTDARPVACGASAAGRSADHGQGTTWAGQN